MKAFIVTCCAMNDREKFLVLPFSLFPSLLLLFILSLSVFPLPIIVSPHSTQAESKQSKESTWICWAFAVLLVIWSVCAHIIMDIKASHPRRLTRRRINSKNFDSLTKYCIVASWMLLMKMNSCVHLGSVQRKKTSMGCMCTGSVMMMSTQFSSSLDLACVL